MGSGKMNPEAMKPFGLALTDYFNGDKEAAFNICCDDGVTSTLPAVVFFRQSTDYDIDRIALDHCRGRVLDIGAGTGLHSLQLQSRGFSVTAIDISPEACNIMRKRGLSEVHCVDICDFKAEPFDTLLILGRGIGMVENIAGLEYFWADMHRLVTPEGQIVLNSADVECTGNPEDLAYQEVNRRTGRYIGEVRMYFEYKGLKGPMCGWLHVAPKTLAEHAVKACWTCEVIVREEDSNYLAKLTKTNKIS